MTGRPKRLGRPGPGGRDNDPDAPAPPLGPRGRLADEQLKAQLDQYLADHGWSIDCLAVAVIRCLHDAAALARFCRALTTNYGANILQVVQAEALRRIGLAGYQRPQ
jgi:hypothetical protein